MKATGVRAGWAAALVAAACGGGSQPASDAGADEDGSVDTAASCELRSGTRLRRELRQHSDGTSAALGLHDTQIGTLCEFGPAEDGSLRCLPEVTNDPVMAGFLHFLDEGCSAQPIAAAGFSVGPQDSPRYMKEYVPSTDGCELWSRYHELGAELDLAEDQRIYFRDSGTGECVGAMAASWRHFAVTGTLAPKALVAGTETWIGDRIRMRQVDGTDGSRWCDVYGELEDADLGGQRCRLSYAEDGVIRILPSKSTRPLHLDAECSAESGYDGVLTGQCTVGPVSYVTTSIGECGYARTVELGEEVGPSYWLRGPSCEPLPASAHTYQLGATVPPTMLAEVSRTSKELGGRLQRREYATPGLRLTRSSWYDTELDTVCLFAEDADGVERCLPGDQPPQRATAAVYRRTYFQDAECTTPTLVAKPRYVASCYENPPVFAKGEGRVFEVGGPMSQPLYQMAGACELAEGSFYEVGAELPLERFVSGERTIE